MRRRLQRLWRRAWQRCPARKAITVTVAAFFFFQFIRFYLVAPLDVFECLEPNFRQGASASENHGHHHDAVELQSHSEDAGYTLQHCKDTYNGIALTPVQPLGLPVAVSQEFLRLALPTAVCEPSQPLENFLPPPFQPPRNLS
ncbi:MAG: hypothetical protein HY648_03435 [Acidobacteria bacterium]|nr:hypothetical protein [Acidobacteriota bacterium]